MRKTLLLSIIFALFVFPCWAQKKITSDARKPTASVKNQISDARKKQFIELLKGLPYKGEFFTDESVQKAAPYLPVLFALTEKDIDKFNMYPFAAISRGIFEQEKYRKYAVSHFAEIQHPDLKLFWAAMLFDENSASPEIAQFLKKVLESPKQTELLSDITGPGFEELKKRIIAYPANQ